MCCDKGDKGDWKERKNWIILMFAGKWVCWIHGHNLAVNSCLFNGLEGFDLSNNLTVLCCVVYDV